MKSWSQSVSHFLNEFLLSGNGRSTENGDREDAKDRLIHCYALINVSNSIC
jgi:hypothetical protein